MNDTRALRELEKGSEDALQILIERYTPYVSTVAANILGPYMSEADVEEVCADTFVALWRNAGSVRPTSLKSWLGSVARNTAKNKLREAGRTLPLEDDMLLIADDAPETEVEQRDEARRVRRAVLSMGQPDREIFLRHYYYGQPVAAVAEAMGINLSTVKTRLRRGREKLKHVLTEESSEEGGVPHAISQHL